MDSLRQDTFTVWIPRPCCDVLTFDGWGQLPFPPYTGIVGFTEDRYQYPTGINYYKNIKLWIQEENNWVLTTNWNHWDEPEVCESNNLYGFGIVFSDAQLGCPFQQKRVRLEKRWKDEGGLDYLCRHVEGTFYFPGYPWTPLCF